MVDTRDTNMVGIVYDGGSKFSDERLKFRCMYEFCECNIKDCIQ